MTHAEKYDRRRQMAMEVKGGDSVATVAVRYQTTMQTVYTACREHGVTFTDYHYKPNQFEILKMMLDGLSPQKIIENTGLTRQRISQIRAKARAAGFIIQPAKNGRPKSE